MMKTTKTTLTRKLEKVYLPGAKGGDPKRYKFDLGDRWFTLTPDKALALANSDACFPTGVNIKVSARLSGSDKERLNHVKVISIDGVDPRAWSERVGSTQVEPSVLEAAQEGIKAAERAEEEAMRNRAPPDPPPTFKSPQDAYARAMGIVRMQYKKANPKLSRQDIWQLRDALNLLAGELGLT